MVKKLETREDAAEVYHLLSLVLPDMEEVEAQQALARLLTARNGGGFSVSPGVQGALTLRAQAVRQKDLEEVVVALLESRVWHLPVPLVSLEMAVRNHLFRLGFSWQVRREGVYPLYRITLAKRRGSGGLWMESLDSPAPWHGMLRLKALWR